ncbi:RNA-binding protein with serine-rich domain 1-B-like [Mercenaria mercenaria]|uniref:RNA-binding protein with serine-rich domain 1-B-like n=1 Tax=Mercenaria mercenaria TaxID=6596 RepID=UPI00234F966E|nr:RNA-binding protein with serine-rich domain 1-B-like [Mercenaria mercenaria]
MPPDRAHPNFAKGFAYVDFATPEEAEKAVKHMDGGQIDGQEVTAQTVLPPRPAPRPARRSPPPGRRGGPPGRWRPSPPRYRDRRT